MKRVAPAAGFTIVEAMVVLTVTAVLFVATATAWSGRQKNSEYQTALRDTRSLLQQTASDVQNGFFPSSKNFSCSAVGAVQFSAITKEQGTNGDCIFLGKALQFGLKDSGNIETLRKYTVAGKSSASTLATAAPTLAPQLTESLRLKADLVTLKISPIGKAGSYNGLAFIPDVGLYSDTGALQSGRQTVRVYGMAGNLSSPAWMGDTFSTSGQPILGSLDLTPITQGVKICMKSGSTGNFAVFTLALDGTTADIKTETTKTDCSV